jgi:hypothetical protein
MNSFNLGSREWGVGSGGQKSEVRSQVGAHCHAPLLLVLLVSLLPTPDSPPPTPHTQLPTPNSLFPVPCKMKSKKSELISTQVKTASAPRSEEAGLACGNAERTSLSL